MKLYKLAITITLLLVEQNFVSAILIDHFTNSGTDVGLISGTDIRGIIRQDDDSWTFSSEGSRAAINPDQSGMLLYTLPQAETIKFDQISTFNFNVISCSETHKTNPKARIIFFDISNVKREYDGISLSGMHASKALNTPFSVDLTQLNQVDEPNFDPNAIKTFTIRFNTGFELFTMELDSIEAVPEPFSLITLAGGVLGFIKRRKNNTCTRRDIKVDFL